MIIARNDTEPEYASEVTMRRLNYMIAAALITSEERTELEMKSYTLTEEQAQQEIERLQDQMPIPGHHTIAHGLEDIRKAVKYAIEKDDYHDYIKRST